MIRVVIADDHAVVRHGLCFLLQQQEDIVVVGECENGQQAKEMVSEHVPDVLLLDLLMPGVDGFTVIQDIARTAPRTQIIVLTSYYEDEQIFRAIKAGALSYLLKDVNAHDLVAAIRAAMRGESTLHPLVARRMLLEFQRRDRSLLQALTPRELDVLKRIARGRTNQEIATDLIIGEETVKSHVSNILSKLHLADRTQAAIYALQQRLIPLDDALDRPDS